MSVRHPQVDTGSRLEDLHWMAATGEHAIGAAHRLGMTYKALEKWARKHAPHAWAVLLARNPRDHNCRTAGRNQWTVV